MGSVERKCRMLFNLSHDYRTAQRMRCLNARIDGGWGARGQQGTKLVLSGLVASTIARTLPQTGEHPAMRRALRYNGAAAGNYASTMAPAGGCAMLYTNKLLTELEAKAGQ